MTRYALAAYGSIRGGGGIRADRDWPSSLLLKEEARSSFGDVGALVAGGVNQWPVLFVFLGCSHRQRRVRKHGRPAGRFLYPHHSLST